MCHVFTSVGPFKLAGPREIAPFFFSRQIVIVNFFCYYGKLEKRIKNHCFPHNLNEAYGLVVEPACTDDKSKDKAQDYQTMLQNH